MRPMIVRPGFRNCAPATCSPCSTKILLNSCRVFQNRANERLICWQGAHTSVYLNVHVHAYKVSILTYLSWINCHFKLWITNMGTLWGWFQGPLFCPLYLGLPRWVPYSINLQMEDRSE